MSRYRFIRAERANYPIATLCCVLCVSRFGYYAWARRGVSARAQAETELLTQIAAAHPRRVAGDGRALRAQARTRLMRAAGPSGRHRRRRARTTVADPAHTPAPHLVARDCTAAAPDRLWVGDITYFATREGWRYLAVLLDAHSRRVVGWAMADRLRQNSDAGW